VWSMQRMYEVEQSAVLRRTGLCGIASGQREHWREEGRLLLKAATKQCDRTVIYV
jgi:hypothetical protein